MLLSVIIPCFNEEKTILSIVEAVNNCPIKNKEVIIVNDCSTDQTGQLLENSSLKIDKIIHHDVNREKGLQFVQEYTCYRQYCGHSRCGFRI